MRKSILIIAAVLTVGAVAAQENYEVSVANSTITWSGSKVIGGSHTGTVNFENGDLVIGDEGLIEASFTVDMTSLVNTDLEGEWKDKLEGHLKSDDFFGVATYENALLAVTNVAPGNNGTANVTADLTIKGITEEITFPALVQVSEGSLIATAELTFDRSKFDVRYGSDSFFDNLGDNTISDDVVVNVELQASTATTGTN